MFQVSTLYSQRFIAVLGIISALHLALTIVRPPRFSVKIKAFAGLAIVFSFRLHDLFVGGMADPMADIACSARCFCFC